MTNKKYVQIYNDITEKITSGLLKPGDKLPKEMDLTTVYHASRVSVRHALKILEGMNIIYRVKKGGTFINGKTNKAHQLVVPFILPDERFLPIYESASRVGLLNNLFFNLYISNNSEEKERKILEEVIKASPKGVILFPVQTFYNIDILLRLESLGTSIVFLDRNVEGIQAPLITSDNEGGMRAIVEAMIKEGHVDLGYFAIHDNMAVTEKERFSGFCDALAANQVPLIKDFVYFTQTYDHYHPEKNCQRFAERLQALDRTPTAICCVNDSSANVLLKSFKKEPKLKNIVVTGFDNFSNDEIDEKFLTAEQSFTEIGKMAVTALWKTLNGEKNGGVFKIPTVLKTKNN
ncbi:MAG: GntR family transcriptional regulator [Bacilli bacterium]|jgi:DNA-binding LacI/PurR family transcriptional regulator|nr:GntR family transcriptional regulator [Bacilli bacterium]